ncbi:MAG: sigma-70 family RNA polymerase sigma factor [Armatimonadetes bacterium]|nr:sigma-70 family RNA polymerase sigma factor [Armatimonadota bacterium]
MMSGTPEPAKDLREMDSDAAGRARFRAVVAEYHAKVYNLIYRYVGDAEEAADLTQDTFVCAFRAWPSFRGDCAVYTWLYRIAINLSKNRLKLLKRRRSAEVVSLDAPVPSEDESLEREVQDWSLSPERALENRELGLFLAVQVAKLPPDFREAVILRDYQGLSYQEVAEIVGCSVKAVKSRLFRARTLLREKLRPYLSD